MNTLTLVRSQNDACFRQEAVGAQPSSGTHLPIVSAGIGALVGWKWGVVPGLLTFGGLYILPAVLVLSAYALAGKGE